MDEPIHVVSESREEYEARQMRDYKKKGVTFTELLAIVLLALGIYLCMSNVLLGIILIILSLIWLGYKLKKGRKKLKEVRDYGKKELYRVRNRRH